MADGPPPGPSKEQRRGYQQGMGGKTARVRLEGMGQTQKHWKIEREGNARAQADGEKKEHEERGAKLVQGRKGTVLKEPRPPGKNVNKKDADAGWAVVQSKNARRKKPRNTPTKLNKEYTFIQDDDPYPTPNSTDVPTTRVFKKQYLVQQESSNSSAHQVTHLGKKALSRPYK